MNQNSSKLGISKVEKAFAKLFIFFLPCKMFSPFFFLSGVTFGLGESASFLFCFLGLLCVAGRGRVAFYNDEGTRLLSCFARLYIICDITSLIMAAVLFHEAGIIGGETTFIAVSKKILYSFAYILFAFYGREIARVLSKEEISKVIDKSLNFCLIIGAIQVLMLLGGNIFKDLYDGINTVFNAWSSSFIMNTNRIALLANEPAYSAGFICTVALPYLLAKMINTGIQFTSITKLSLFAILLFYTKSTSGYVILFVDLIVFSIAVLANGRNVSKNNRVALGLLLVFCFLAIALIMLRSGFVSNTVNKVLDKLFSYDNPYSADRKGIIAVGLKLLGRYPLFGVGNGNQGFFYQELLPAWAYNAYTGFNEYKRASTVLFDGGPFWIAFISGYGMTGILLMGSFLIKSFRIIKTYRSAFGHYYFFYIISIIGLFINGIGATLDSKYYFWFVLSIPMMVSYWKEDLIINSIP